MAKLNILQSLWAMERRHTDGFERSLEANVSLVAEAGFAGVSTHWTDRDSVSRLSGLLRERGLVAEGQCFPATVDDLKPVLEIAAAFPVQHINLQPDVRPRRLEDCIPLVEGWLRLGQEAGIPVWIETHRDRMTTDLYVILDLLDRFPDMPLIADLSHILVGREFPWPVPEENHAMVRRLLDNTHALHGRVASREQVQIEIAFPHHKPLVDLFLGWWDYGLRQMHGRAGPDGAICFTCELGPKPYAITGRDGNDTTDRWQESLQMKAMIEQLDAAIRAEPTGTARTVSA